MSLTMISHQIISSGELCERPCRTLKTAIGLGEKKRRPARNASIFVPSKTKNAKRGRLRI